MTEFQVDVYLPTYKPKPEHLKAAVNSVLNQNKRNWQLWVCDQVSETNTRRLIEPYLKDKRIHFYLNKDHPGIGANWNQCLKSGDAPVIQYMFQDDLWQPDYLETGLQILEDQPGAGFVSLGHEYVFEGDIPTKNVYSDLQEQLKQVFPGYHNGPEFLMWWLEKGLHPNLIGEPMFVMLRRELINRVGFFREDMNQNLDSEYWARCLLRADWYYQPGNFGSFRVHPGSASQQNYREGRGLFDRYRMMKDIIKLIPDGYKKEARKHLNKHRYLMMQKFLERYTGTKIPPQEKESSVKYFFKNFVLFLRAIINFSRKKIF